MSINSNGKNGCQLDDNRYMEDLSCSLKDMVLGFDEKITNCFDDYEDSQQLMPIPVRPQEDVISEDE